MKRLLFVYNPCGNRPDSRNLEAILYGFITADYVGKYM